MPTLILQGDDDQIVPIAASAMVSVTLGKGSTLKVYPGFSNRLIHPRGGHRAYADRDQGGNRPQGHGSEL